MSDAQRLMWVRAVHTAIYILMVGCIFAVLYAGITGAHGRWLGVAAGLVALEAVVFAASGMKCPLTAVAVKYGAGDGPLFDTFLPERFTRHTFRIFAPLMAAGFVLIGARALWLGWAPG